MASFAALFALLLLASAASAQVTLNCPSFGSTTTYSWNPDIYPAIYVQTTLPSNSYISPGMTCFFDIKANQLGRVVVLVTDNDLNAYYASISIRTYPLSGYLADWGYLTFNEDKHRNFVGLENRLYISFSTNSNPIGSARGVKLQLTFLKFNGCLPSWSLVSLAGRSHCVGLPTSKAYQFGSAQRYCNLMRSNLLVSDRDNVSSALSRVSFGNAWIGMTAEPSGTYSSFRWINNMPVSYNQYVLCPAGCRPGSTAYRCVSASNSSGLTLVQSQCSQALQPICYMPAGGTDLFYDGSAAAKASVGLLAASAFLSWALGR